MSTPWRLPIDDESMIYGLKRRRTRSMAMHLFDEDPSMGMPSKQEHVDDSLGNPENTLSEILLKASPNLALATIVG